MIETNTNQLEAILNRAFSDIKVTLINAEKDDITIPDEYQRTLGFLLPEIKESNYFSLKERLSDHIKDISNGNVDFDDWCNYLSFALGQNDFGHRAVNIILDSIDVISNDIDLHKYSEFIDVICQNNLLLHSHKLKGIIYSDAAQDTRTHFLKYFSLLKGIPNEPETYTPEPWILDFMKFLGEDPEKYTGSEELPYIPLPECTETWLEDTAQDFKMPKERLISWMETVLSEREEVQKRIDSSVENGKLTSGDAINEMIGLFQYIDAIPAMFEAHVNPFEAFRLRDYLNFHDNGTSVRFFIYVINSDHDLDTKIRYLKYHNFLSAIRTDKILGLNVPRCEESWLQEMAEKLHLDYDKFKPWLDKAIDSQAYWMNKGVMQEIADQGVDIIKAHDLRGYLNMPTTRIIALKNIINSDAPLPSKMGFLEGIKDKFYLLEIDTPQGLEDTNWIQEAERKVQNFFVDQGIQLQYPARFIGTLLGSVKDGRKDLLKLAELETKGTQINKLFIPGAVYAEERIFGLNERVDPIYATRLLLYGLISRQEDCYKEAARYFLDSKLKKARSFIEKSHVPAHKLFHYMKEQIRAMEQNNCSVHTGRETVDTIRNLYLNSAKAADGRTELRELVWLVESLYENSEIFDTITVKMQDGTLYDLADGERLLCCAMVSEDREIDEIESIYYCLDPYIALMHVIPSLNGVYGMPIGAAILANTVLENQQSVLLVDSLEAGELFQQINERQSFRLVTQGIVGAAEDTNSSFVFYNVRVGNTVSLRYANNISKLADLDKPHEYVLAKLQDGQITTRKKRYLEAFADREKLAGSVEGYMIETKRLKALVK